MLLPRLQPLVPFEVPYWTALSVHATSAIAYPLFPWIRSRISGSADQRPRTVRRAITFIGILLFGLVMIEAAGRAGYEPRWPFTSTSRIETERQFLMEITTHHRGIELANSALSRPLSSETSALARLIIAEQSRERRLLETWWEGWFGGELPVTSGAVPGMPQRDRVAALTASTESEREREFLRLMKDHHSAAIRMTEAQRRRFADPRLRLFAASMTHAQTGQTAWMLALLGNPPAGVSTAPMIWCRQSPFRRRGAGPSPKARRLRTRSPSICQIVPQRSHRQYAPVVVGTVMSTGRWPHVGHSTSAVSFSVATSDLSRGRALVTVLQSLRTLCALIVNVPIRRRPSRIRRPNTR